MILRLAVHFMNIINMIDIYLLLFLYFSLLLIFKLFEFQSRNFTYPYRSNRKNKLPGQETLVVKTPSVCT